MKVLRSTTSSTASSQGHQGSTEHLTAATGSAKHQTQPGTPRYFHLLLLVCVVRTHCIIHGSRTSSLSGSGSGSGGSHNLKHHDELHDDSSIFNVGGSGLSDSGSEPAELDLGRTSDHKTPTSITAGSHHGSTSTENLTDSHHGSTDNLTQADKHQTQSETGSHHGSSTSSVPAHGQK